jgi:hypothetical protein
MLWLQIPSKSDRLQSADATQAVRKPAWRHIGLRGAGTLVLEAALDNQTDRRVPSSMLRNDILEGFAAQGSNILSNQKLTGNSRALNSSLGAHELHTLLLPMHVPFQGPRNRVQCCSWSCATCRLALVCPYYCPHLTPSHENQHGKAPMAMPPCRGRAM